MRFDKICFYCLFFINIFPVHGGDPQQPSSFQGGITQQVGDFLTKYATVNNKNAQAENFHLQRQLRQKDAELARLQQSLKKAHDELLKKSEAMASLQEIARTLNIPIPKDASVLFLKKSILNRIQTTPYLPSVRLSREQLLILNDLLSDEPGVLQTIKKYDIFFKEIEGKKLILISDF